ncbi:MAG: acetate--CoA ligase family protein [Candidatus Pacebacteria bacterium]|nr:acetate--CoA ligase family protein [Candidatus Paceibacterota bacterium]
MEILSFEETRRLLLKYKLPFCRTEIFNSKDKAVVFAEKIGFPVVLKVHAQKIFHKSEIGGVKTNIRNKEDFEKAWLEIEKNIRGKNIEGMLVQEMRSGSEIALGMKRDPQFGPVLLFGLGGIFIEIIKDVSLRVAPISREEALAMIKETKGAKVLEGARGRKKADLGIIADMLVNLSNLSIKEEKIQSIDFNPVMVEGDKACIADFRIIV